MRSARADLAMVLASACFLALVTTVFASCPGGLPRTYLSAAEPAESWSIWAQNFTFTGCGFNAFDALTLNITLGTTELLSASCELVSITDTEIVCQTQPHTKHIESASVTIRSAHVTQEDPAGELVVTLPNALAIFLPDLTTVRPSRMALTANGPVVATVNGLVHGAEYRVIVSGADQDPDTTAATPVVESGSRFLVFQSGVATRTGYHTVHLLQVMPDLNVSKYRSADSLSALAGAASCAGRTFRARNSQTGRVESLRGLSSLPDGFLYYDAAPAPLMNSYISEVVPGWLPRSPAAAALGSKPVSSAVTLRGANLGADGEVPTVSINGLPCTVTVATAESVTCTVPPCTDAACYGTGAVVLATTSGAVATSEFAFTAPLTATDIFPLSVLPAETPQSVYIRMSASPADRLYVRIGATLTMQPAFHDSEGLRFELPVCRPVPTPGSTPAVALAPDCANVSGAVSFYSHLDAPAPVFESRFLVERYSEPRVEATVLLAAFAPRLLEIGDSNVYSLWAVSPTFGTAVRGSLIGAAADGGDVALNFAGAPHGQSVLFTAPGCRESRDPLPEPTPELLWEAGRGMIAPRVPTCIPGKYPVRLYDAEGRMVSDVVKRAVFPLVMNPALGVMASLAFAGVRPAVGSDEEHAHALAVVRAVTDSTGIALQRLFSVSYDPDASVFIINIVIMPNHHNARPTPLSLARLITQHVSDATSVLRRRLPTLESLEIPPATVQRCENGAFARDCNESGPEARGEQSFWTEHPFLTALGVLTVVALAATVAYCACRRRRRHSHASLLGDTDMDAVAVVSGTGAAGASASADLRAVNGDASTIAAGSAWVPPLVITSADAEAARVAALAEHAAAALAEHAAAHRTLNRLHPDVAVISALPAPAALNPAHTESDMYIPPAPPVKPSSASVRALLPRADACPAPISAADASPDAVVLSTSVGCVPSAVLRRSAGDAESDAMLGSTPPASAAAEAAAMAIAAATAAAPAGPGDGRAPFHAVYGPGGTRRSITVSAATAAAAAAGAAAPGAGSGAANGYLVLPVGASNLSALLNREDLAR